MLMASMFEPFSKCLERLNKELEEAPLQGKFKKSARCIELSPPNL